MRDQSVLHSVSRRWKYVTCVLICLLVSLLLLVFIVLPELGDRKVSRRSLAADRNTTAATPTQVRLVNGRNRCEGRVEVLYNETWGTVCDDDWDMVDANVVCRQLECGMAVAVGSSSRYGQGSGPILLDNVDCKGGEMDLGQCGSQGWGIHNCYHYEDVAVTCRGSTAIGSRGIPEEPTTPSRRNSGLRDGTIRLVGGSDRCQGRVEIYYRGSWGTVCDDDWEIRDATVVCQQVGCGTAITHTTNAYFGYGSGLIMLDNVNCNGYESHLATCYSLGWGIHNCGHHEDAGVICTGLSTTSVPPLDTETMGRGFFLTESTAETGMTVAVTDTTQRPSTEMTTREQPPIRLVNGNGSCQGRVEVSHGQVWGTVCDDDWDIENAHVVCRQLGCGPATAALPLAYFGYGSGPILLDNVDCQGDEGALADCFNLGWGQHNCGHHEDAGVICSTFLPFPEGTSRSFGVTDRIVTRPAPVEGTMRLVGGQHRCEGRVELFQRGDWGTVCDDAWDLPDAQVVCRLLGCGDAVFARVEAFFGPGKGTILMDNVKCTGTEASLQQCSHISWHVHNCNHSEDAGVTCSLS